MEQIKVLTGKVIKGHSRGKKLGFPTINMPLSGHFEEGIYISRITIDAKEYNALTFIGPAKTFGATESLVETYVFDFHEEVYGQKVTVTLLKKLRDNQKFDSPEALVAQMEEDKKQAKEFFNNLTSY